MSEPISPCRNICRLDESGTLCLGCGRSLAEIAAWPSLDVQARRAIMDRLKGRRAADEASEANVR